MVVVLVEQLTSKQTHGESIFNNAQVEDFKWLPKDIYRGTKKSKVLKSRLSFFFSFKIILVNILWIIIVMVLFAFAAGSMFG